MAITNDTPARTLPFFSGTIDVKRNVYGENVVESTENSTQKAIFSIPIEQESSHFINIKYKAENKLFSELLIGEYVIGVSKDASNPANLQINAINWVESTVALNVIKNTAISSAIIADILYIYIKGASATDLIWTVEYEDIETIRKA